MPARATMEQVRAFRLAAHGVAVAHEDPLAALASWAVQDSPPGAAAQALHARVAALDPGWLDAALEDRRVVALYSARTATVLLPAADAGRYTAAIRPRGDAELRAVLNRAVPDDHGDVAGAAETAVAAVADALDGRVLSRDALHEALRQRLPAELLPWCPGCGSHHARRNLLVYAGLCDRLCLAGRAGRQPAFARTDQWLEARAAPGDDGGRDLVCRYLRFYGPSSPGAFAEWAGIGRAHAQRLWESAEDDMAEARVGDGPVRRLRREDVPALAGTPPAQGVRLLPPGDPLLQARDRDLLVDDDAVRRRVWIAINAPGLVLADGVAVAMWRSRKRGRRLEVEVEPFESGAASVVPALEAEAGRLAPHRGCTSATVALRS